MRHRGSTLRGENGEADWVQLGDKSHEQGAGAMAGGEMWNRDEHWEKPPETNGGLTVINGGFMVV